MRYFFCLLLCCFTMAVFANVFTYKDAQGNVVFTDTPTNSNAQPLSSEDIGKPIVVPSRNTATQTDDKTKTDNLADQHQNYTSLEIVTPKDQETFQNQPNITVEVSTTPKLQKGDLIQIFLDSTPWSPPQPIIRFSFMRPNRGTHTLTAKLLNKNQQVLLETKPITIFVHQAHLGNFPVRSP